MEFVHQPYRPGETVAAIATPPGEGGVAIIRISGAAALDVADRVFSGDVASYKSHTAHYGQIVDAEGKVVDDVLVLPMLGSRSFTGEDTVEIHCHGGALITRRVLDVVLAAGARQAMAGEFAFKAFMNGKIDLAQAEAIQQLIAAKNERALDAAEGQLQGALSKKVAAFQLELTDTAAILEAWVDFPEEGLEFTTEEALISQLNQVKEKIGQLVDSYHDGKIVSNDIALCLVGSPNVGKSSLMNALLDKERAIVSPIPGTTRDFVEDHLRINTLNFRLIDTAGIRTSEEWIEKEGIRRTKEVIKEADLILLVLDATQALSDEEMHLIKTLPKEKTIAIWNKVDLPHEALPELPLLYQTEISAKERSGFDQLHALLDRVVWEGAPPDREAFLVTNSRHFEALKNAKEACQRVVDGLEERVSPEFLAADLRISLSELGKIIGVNISEEILSAIFSKFCIGK